MATDINAAKSTIAHDGGLPLAKTSAQDSISGINFGDIIRKSGSRVDTGLNLLSDRAGITGVSDQIKNAPAHDDYTFDENNTRNDDKRSRASFDDNSDHTQERNITNNADYSTDYAGNDTQDYKPEMQGTTNDKSADNKKHAENKQHDDRVNNGSESAKNEERDSASLEQSGNNEINQTSNSNAIESNNNKDILKSLITTPQFNISLGQANSGAAREDSIVPVQSVEQTKTNIPNNIEKTNKAAVLAMVASGSTVETNNNSAKIEQFGTKAQNTLAQPTSQNLSNIPGQSQSHNTSSADLLAAAGAQEIISSKTNEQANQLSKMVGNNKKLDVSVTITDEKSTLVSKPTANLSSSGIITTDTTAASLRSQQSKGVDKANATGQSQQTSEQIFGTTTQVQQAVGSKTQPSGSTTANMKGAAILGIQNIGAQGNFTGNGETPITTAPNSINAAQQAQHNTSTQAANSARFTTANHAVVEQVSVQISKALNAGNDRISIQLKPADLGRVDVQMEVGHDGRVTAVVTADNKQTLDLLQKDSKQLQEALQQAGLQADEDSLSFNLREQDDSQDMAKSDGNGMSEGSDSELTLDEELAGIKPDIITDTRVDVRA